MIHRYIVRPRTAGAGFELTGPLLPYPLRYADECQAASMAHHLGACTGGVLIILCDHGLPITETIERQWEEQGMTPTGFLDHMLSIAKATQ